MSQLEEELQQFGEMEQDLTRSIRLQLATRETIRNHIVVLMSRKIARARRMAIGRRYVNGNSDMRSHIRSQPWRNERYDQGRSPSPSFEELTAYAYRSPPIERVSPFMPSITQSTSMMSIVANENYVQLPVESPRVQPTDQDVPDEEYPYVQTVNSDETWD